MGYYISHSGAYRYNDRCHDIRFTDSSKLDYFFYLAFVNLEFGVMNLNFYLLKVTRYNRIIFFRYKVFLEFLLGLTVAILTYF